jgi:hypothetical protein
MFTAIFTIEPAGHGAAFFPTEKDANGGSTYKLSKSHLIFNQKSDIIELSPTAREQLARENEEKFQKSGNPGNETEKSANGRKLSKEEQKEVKDLERIDRQVRSRELTHRAVAGNYAKGSVYFDYVTGPDGKKYAEEGHINIDSRPVPNNPEATIRKAQAIRSVGLTPTSTSPQNRTDFAEISKIEREARMELMTEQRKVSEGAPKAVFEEKTIVQLSYMA